MRIKCTTLFDITKTNISNRRGWLDRTVDPTFDKLRNQQSNFETLLQIISLRSQPEDISDPIKKCIANNNFGLNYKKKKITYWEFIFTIYHNGIFMHEGNKLGKLFLDCDGVPLIINLDEMPNLSNMLDISDQYKNIHFEVIDEA